MRVIVATNIKTGEEKVYLTAKEAAADTGILARNIYGACIGERKQSMGYRFRYDGTIMPLGPDDAAIIVALANNGLAIQRAAIEAHMSPNSVRYRVDRIKADTGKDPQDFWDMIELVAMAKQVQEKEKQL